MWNAYCCLLESNCTLQYWNSGVLVLYNLKITLVVLCQVKVENRIKQTKKKIFSRFATNSDLSLKKKLFSKILLYWYTIFSHKYLLKFSYYVSQFLNYIFKKITPFWIAEIHIYIHISLCNTISKQVLKEQLNILKFRWRCLLKCSLFFSYVHWQNVGSKSLCVMPHNLVSKSQNALSTERTLWDFLESSFFY